MKFRMLKHQKGVGLDPLTPPPHGYAHERPLDTLILLLNCLVALFKFKMLYSDPV